MTVINPGVIVLPSLSVVPVVQFLEIAYATPGPFSQLLGLGDTA
jgi:hypothetical protein